MTHVPTVQQDCEEAAGNMGAETGVVKYAVCLLNMVVFTNPACYHQDPSGNTISTCESTCASD